MKVGDENMNSNPKLGTKTKKKISIQGLNPKTHQFIGTKKYLIQNFGFVFISSSITIIQIMNFFKSKIIPYLFLIFHFHKNNFSHFYQDQKLPLYNKNPPILFGDKACKLVSHH